MPVIKRPVTRRAVHKQPPPLPEYELPVRARLQRKLVAPVPRPGKRARCGNFESSRGAQKAYIDEGRKPPPIPDDPLTARVQLRAPPQAMTGPEFGPRRQAQGKHLMSPSVYVDFHPFAETLREWETGVPVDCGTDWEWKTIEAAIEQGPHKSATSAESIALVKEDVDYQVRAGYAEIIPWKKLRKLRPRQLKISPLAVVPQRNRRGRMILDLSFAVRKGKRGRKRGRNDEVLLQESVNDSTVRQAPDVPVKELGNVLPRLLDFMTTVPAEEHIYFSKLDLADGYWRMIVEQEQRWNFAYVMPGEPGDEVMIVVPSALQMGWNESPAYFCATTETVRDISQAWIDQKTELPDHPMEEYCAPTTPARKQSSNGTNYQMSSVYVDDHIMAAVEDATGTLLHRTARATLHAIHNVFQTPAATGTPDAKDPISEKKLIKGDGRWDTRKEILGYMVDGIARTIELPVDRAEALLKEVRAILKKKRVQLKRFRSIVGRLQHAARILPVAKSFFTPLYNALKGLPDSVGLSSTGEVREALLDVAGVIKDMARRPTHVSELVQRPLEYVGFCDASAFGAGGVWFGAGTPLHPHVWRVQWPKDITDAVVTDNNPTGTLTNSDLEMAGVLLQETVLEASLGSALHGIQTAIGCDNSPAVAWTTRMATRSASPISYRLLKGLAMRQRTTQSAPPAVYHLAGTRNQFADVASRKATGVPNHFHSMEKSPESMCPESFLTLFNSSFPLPQRLSWHNVQPPLGLWQNVIATLRGQRLTLRQWMTPLAEPVSSIGLPMLQHGDSTLGSDMSRYYNSKNCSLPLPPGFELEYSGVVSKLDPKLWKQRCCTWQRPSLWLDFPTPEKPTREAKTSR
jgi:hypothetical protein